MWISIDFMNMPDSQPGHDDVTKWKHFPRYWPLVRGIHQSPVNSPHKGQWHGALVFSLVCPWINGWVNNRKAGDLRCHGTDYDVIVVVFYSSIIGDTLLLIYQSPVTTAHLRTMTCYLQMYTCDLWHLSLIESQYWGFGFITLCVHCCVCISDKLQLQPILQTDTTHTVVVTSPGLRQYRSY